MAINGLKQTISKSLFALVACTVSLSAINPAYSCGPFFEQAVFSYDLHPDLPLQFFAEGKLGVVQPTFARSYLFVAYRYFKGTSLTADERQQMLNFWRFRLSSLSGDDSNASALWLKMRAKAALALSGIDKIENIDQYRQAGGPDDYNPYLNCTADAFTQATKTLQDKVARFGPGASEVKDWLAAQDKVFCHCSTPQYNYSTKTQTPEPAFPQPAPASASVEVKQERAYQIAAAHFYAKDFDQAAKDFALIALDPGSPYQKLSAYLVARSLIRKATVGSLKAVDQSALLAAKEKLITLSADPSMSSFSQSLGALLKFVAVRLDPANTLTEMSKKLAAGNDSNLYEDIESYIYILDSAFKEDSEDAVAAHKVEDAKLAQSMHKDDMTDWIWTFSSNDKESADHALSRYQTDKNTAWLICLASKLQGHETVSTEVLAGLKNVPANNPAFVTASYHRARILAARGDKEAIDVIDKALIESKAPSSLNALNLLKLRSAKSLDEFMALAYSSPALLVVEGESALLASQWDEDEKKKVVAYKTLAPLLRPEAAVVINQKFSLDQYLVAAQSQYVPKTLRADFAQAAFCRSVLLHDQGSTAKAITLLKQSMPTVASYLTNYEQAPADSKEFSAVYMFLKNPGSRPYVTAGVARETAFSRLDDYQDNWWDAIKLDGATKIGDSFLKTADLSKAKSEIALINTQSPAPNYLGRVVCDYAKTHKTDSRVPEALHLVVRATKLGATDAKTSAVSKLAFQILHQNYKGNAWTAKTPFYF